MKYLLLTIFVGMMAYFWSQQKNYSKTERAISSERKTSSGDKVFPFYSLNTPNVPHGRSLFDELLAYWGKTPVGLSELRSKLEEVYGYEPIPVLFASSRSLQANSISYSKPRVVLSGDFFTSLEKTPVSKIEGLPFYLENRLFFGYSEKSDSLEIMSFNDHDQRFEFQVVHHFSDKDKQQILYAERGQCLSCHYGEGPIFSILPWRETNSFRRTASEMAKQIGKESYLGIKLYDKKQRPKFAFKIDRSVKHALFDWMTVNTVWNHVCYDDLDCRKHALFFALNEYCQRDDLKNSWNIIVKEFLNENKNFNLSYGNPVLIDKNPEQELNTITDPKERIYTKYAGQSVFLEWPELISKHLKRMSGEKVCSVDAAKIVDKVSDYISSNKTYDPEEFVFKLAYNKKPLSNLVFPEKKQAEFIRPFFDSLEVNNNVVENFRFFCGRCHSHNDDIGFLNGSENEVVEKLNNYSEQINSRLNWFENDSAGQMPPEGSEEHNMLKKNIKFVKGLRNFLND